MLGQQFYHETMRNVIVAFGTLFNNIHLVRKNNSGNIIQTMKVPLAYGPRQKWLTRLDADANLNTKVAITLPRLGFEIQNLTYDPSRKLNRVQKFKKVKKYYLIIFRINIVSKLFYSEIVYNINY